MSTFTTSYADLLASLYADIEAVLIEYAELSTRPPSAGDALWNKFAALRARLTELRQGALAELADDAAQPGIEATARRFLADMENLLDVEHEGDDWEAYVGAAMIHAENRICDEARWVERWA